VISVQGVRKSYTDGDREIRVLDGVDLQVAPGEFVAVVGSSGCGKSTLLHVLGGLDVDYEGEISVDGVNLQGLRDRPLAAFRNRHVGFVFQFFHLISNMSAQDNVMLPAFFGGGAPGPEHRGRASAMLERVGLAGKERRAPMKLSGGERQRVAIARALFVQPRVLLCDEPTGNLDAATGGEIIELFRTLNQEGLTVLAVTHEERVSAAASRVLRLRDGKMWDERLAAGGLG
jgi:putative ABC transport system ATP-binding protein